MRVVLADLKGTTGLVSKDTVAGGYGSRLRPFSRVSSILGQVKRRLHAPPSVQMAYLAALAADRGHDVAWTSDHAPVEYPRTPHCPSSSYRIAEQAPDVSPKSVCA